MLYERIRRAVKTGNQAFIVYPLVEGSEALDLKDATGMARELQERVFPEYPVGLLHGRMKGREKEEIMAAFQKGEIPILVSTTVIEVGIDVPTASLMVVEHAERFGLSQLHQLRGRVGRGGGAAQCLLMAGDPLSAVSRKRLKVMAETNDGFRIAEEDLEIRGPGNSWEHGSPVSPISGWPTSCGTGHFSMKPGKRPSLPLTKWRKSRRAVT